jgi:hypothetical protein
MMVAAVQWRAEVALGVPNHLHLPRMPLGDRVAGHRHRLGRIEVVDDEALLLMLRPQVIEGFGGPADGAVIEEMRVHRLMPAVFADDEILAQGQSAPHHMAVDALMVKAPARYVNIM